MINHISSTSLENLVKEHGFGITVASSNYLLHGFTFVVLKEHDNDFYDVLIQNGEVLRYSKSNPETNDYYLVEK